MALLRTLGAASRPRGSLGSTGLVTPALVSVLSELSATKRSCYLGARVTDKMVPPVQVSPLIKLGRYSALFLGMAYGAKRYSECPRASAAPRPEWERGGAGGP